MQSTLYKSHPPPPTTTIDLDSELQDPQDGISNATSLIYNGKKEPLTKLKLDQDKAKQERNRARLKLLDQHKAVDLSEDSDDNIEEEAKELFGELAVSPKLYDKHETEGKDEATTERGAKSTRTDISFNAELIKREMRRESRLDIQKLRQEKEEKRQLLLMEPKRLAYNKFSKKNKVLKKKTLQMVAQRFDDYYAYENSHDYNGQVVGLNQIAEMFAIGPLTIHKLYQEWLEDPTFYDRVIRYDFHKRTPEKKLIVERLEHIARLVKENPFMTQSELCVELNKIEDLKSFKDGQRVDINKTIVAKLLKLGKFRKKRVRCVPKEKNTTKSLERRYEFCVSYKALLDKNAKIYFLDESGFNLYMTRDKAWSRPHEEITVNCPISKGKRFSLIAIIEEDGLANWRIIDGTYRKYEYLDFIRELFEKLHDLPDEQGREKWLVMDNCAIHDKEETYRIAHKWGVQILFLPPYSPQLNPIEMWFHEVKTNIRKVNYSGEKQLLEIMQREFQRYENHDFSNYFHGTLKYVEKGLRKEKY